MIITCDRTFLPSSYDLTLLHFSTSYFSTSVLIMLSSLILLVTCSFMLLISSLLPLFSFFLAHVSPLYPSSRPRSLFNFLLFFPSSVFLPLFLYSGLSFYLCNVISHTSNFVPTPSNFLFSFTFFFPHPLFTSHYLLSTSFFLLLCPYNPFFYCVT